MAEQRRSQREDRTSEDGRRAGSEPERESHLPIGSDDISARAYELYEERGGEHGRDWDDWLQAERELQARRRTPGPTPS